RCRTPYRCGRPPSLPAPTSPVAATASSWSSDVSEGLEPASERVVHDDAVRRLLRKQAVGAARICGHTMREPAFQLGLERRVAPRAIVVLGGGESQVVDAEPIARRVLDQLEPGR